MNILYIGYWSFHDGLTKSTIFPHLKILSGFDQVKKIIFVSIERERKIKPAFISIPKCQHVPLYSRNLPVKMINKRYDFYRFPKVIKKIIKNDHIDLCIGAGTQAGTLALKAAQKTNVKTIVSYFDPHAEYMRALGIWRKYDPRYLYLSSWEKRLKKDSFALFPVSNGYRKTLAEENTDSEKLFTVPCATDLEKFRINRVIGNLIREQLNWNKNDFVGIYVGKFGDLYFKDEAFIWFGELKKQNPLFKLIILTGQDKDWIRSELMKAGFADDDIFIGLVNHDEVAGYLNAADFAFCLHRPHRISHAYSPVKNGEYWACGLPVMIPVGIGDDSRILKETGLGVVVEDIEHPEKNLPMLDELVKSGKKKEIRKLAIKYRNPEISRKAYEKLISLVNTP